MKKIFMLLLCIPLLTQAQNNQVVNSLRVFPKPGKSAELEKALAAHAQKYHTGNVKWRIFSIQSGPDFGGYHIVEGPTTWEALDKRGDLGQAHTDDWNKNIEPLLSDKISSSYASYRADLSSVPLTDYTDKISIIHWYPKIGHRTEVENMLKMMKKMWDASEETVAVYQTESSGELQFTLVTRYKKGLIERTPGYRKPVRERFEQANGAGSWDTYLNMLKQSIDKSYSEMLFFRADLSSK